jgi:cell division protein FtsX
VHNSTHGRSSSVLEDVGKQFGYNDRAFFAQWKAPVNINAFLAIGIIGLIATFMTEVAAGLLSGTFGQHPLANWLPYYVVWIIFTILGLVIRKNAKPRE